MGTIVCQVCDNTIAHFEDEKVTVLYGNCCSCSHCHAREERKEA